MGRLLLKVVAGAFALILALSLLSYHPLDPHPFSQGGAGVPVHNLCGVLGAFLAGTLETLVGAGAWMVPPYILWECFPPAKPQWARRLAWLVLALAAWTLLGGLGPRLWPMGDNLPPMELRWGGWMGRLLWPLCRQGFGPVGLAVVMGALILLCLLVLAPRATQAAGNHTARWLGGTALPWMKPLPGRGARGVLGFLKRPFRKGPGGRKEARELDAQDVRDLLHTAPPKPAEDDLVAALERAERSSAEYRKANGNTLVEPDLPFIQSINLDSGEPLRPDPGYLDAQSFAPAREPLPPAVLLRDLPVPSVKVPLVAPRVERDAYGRISEQLPLGLTEPTPPPMPPLPEPEAPLLRPAPPVPSVQASPRSPSIRLGASPSGRLPDPPERPPVALGPTPGPLGVTPEPLPPSIRLSASQPGRFPDPSERLSAPLLTPQPLEATPGPLLTPGPLPTPQPLPDPPASRPSQALPRAQAAPREPAPRSQEVPAGGVVDREQLPPRRLFDPPQVEHRLDPVKLEATRTLLQQKFTEFKVKGNVTGMQPGPVVTVFEFQPDPGVPVAKVLSMEEDLALGLQAEKVRIDRIPGRNLVGIEVPNARRETISFREVVDSPAFRDPSQKDGMSLLTLALGKDMAGHPVVADLAKMPHLLIGGSTGSGKSVGVNAMICSILLRALPSEVKLILVDPKMVEMGIYEAIPHLWAPVVTDMKEAGRVLKWVVAQMEDRYKRLAMLSVRNLEGFNAKVLEAGGAIDLSDRTPNPRWPERPAFLEPLPYVVVVIDELADLMMVCRSEVEESIARIAQKARAVGIHLVLATQRPSVDIVTGVIKANLPSRLSYRVNTKIDSRTILDSGGGEQLLGKGDALFLAPGSARPRRIHAPFLTEEETLRLVEWLKERGAPDYNRALISAMETDEETGGDGPMDAGGGEADIYERAVAVVKRERKASTSLLQRKLNIGYGRAARIIDRMEDEGIIGGDRGAGKPREVLVGEE